MLPVILSTALALAPRSPLPPIAVELPAAAQGAPAAPLVLGLKFDDALRVRVGPDGRLRGPGPVAAAQALISAQGLRAEGLRVADPAALAALIARAEARSGVAAPDLGGLIRVAVIGISDAAAVELAQALQSLPGVEYATLHRMAPPPTDVAPATPDFTASQGYLGPDPGVNAERVHAMGLRGAGVRLSDCEYGWITAHEDLVDKPMTVEAGVVISPAVAAYGYDHHGTAVLGEVVGVHNGYGVDGLAPDVEVGLYPELLEGGLWRRPDAILAAVTESLPGDVVLLEMQVAGYSGGNYGPAELDPNVFLIVQTATAAGVVVVGAAGNGAQDLDAGWYASNYMTWGDSGAIIVGAGTPDTLHDAQSFSTHGSRVNLQGWGSSVFTTGYGDAGIADGGNEQTYTAGFGGTSGATPMVAAAAALVQAQHLALTGAPMDPLLLRELLVATGLPQGSGPPIGPLPDIEAAVLALDGDGDGVMNADWGGEDCDDRASNAYPGAEEIAYDGVDNDCIGGDLNDVDGDGAVAQEAGGPDCVDTDPAIGPGATDVWYDGVDTDCDGNDDDADGDGVGLGADCDDADPAVSPEVAERGGNGLDDDCDGRVDESTGGGGKGGCASHTGGPGAGLALLAALALLSRRRGA
jgi:hypothetical protein